MGIGGVGLPLPSPSPSQFHPGVGMGRGGVWREWVGWVGKDVMGMRGDGDEGGWG